ncbi:MAG: hypothetical protein C0623_02425 [Desulfuromonas sp.]|nr:MAG: hypothetical protein C0623_02425 [Desulfuromonas sp.]
MKRFLLISSFLLLLPANAWVAEDVAAKTDSIDDLNYSLGYYLGLELKKAGVEMRPEPLYQAIYAALAQDQKPALSREEMAALLQDAREQSQ